MRRKITSAIIGAMIKRLLVAMDKDINSVMIIAPAGRRRDNLLTMVKSSLGNVDVRVAENFESCLPAESLAAPMLFLLDHGLAEAEVERDLETIYSHYPQALALLISSRPASEVNLAHFRPDGVLLDGFTPAVLMNLISELTISSPRSLLV
jgi:hypothetical protein